MSKMSTDLEMLMALLNKSGRLYDEEVQKDLNKTIIQIHVGDFRMQWEFDSTTGELIEDWDNHAVTTWLTGGYYYD